MDMGLGEGEEEMGCLCLLLQWCYLKKDPVLSRL